MTPSASTSRVCIICLQVEILGLVPPLKGLVLEQGAIGQGALRGPVRCPSLVVAQAQTLATARHWETISAVQLEYSLVERNIEFEYTAMAQALGTGIIVWSPLASGLLSGKYRPSEQGGVGEGRLSTLANSGNPAFNKFTKQNWAILAELEAVAGELGRSMAQVALNWVANRPAIASVIIGATKLHQLEDNLGALDLEIPAELLQRLDAVSRPEARFPYTFFEPTLQGMIHCNATVGDKHGGG
ncbi:aldo/keto reductase [Leptolyngbya sp. KIOST-1]|uniref:aldo/keto reductase n=1 Tax=Leptolyngbya sp. KIOST-1 TaxID=1229172 RepID=UPI0021F13D6A|nr:aldo/keto reductase [Leptolyngbya sp. KIOST-1]